MIFGVIDGRMAYPSDCVVKFLSLAFKCCQDETDAWPSMTEVVRELWKYMGYDARVWHQKGRSHGHWCCKGYDSAIIMHPPMWRILLCRWINIYQAATLIVELSQRSRLDRKHSGRIWLILPFTQNFELGNFSLWSSFLILCIISLTLSCYTFFFVETL
jgi:hypothetical protein